MVLFYEKWKKYNEIQLKKIKNETITVTRAYRSTLVALPRSSGWITQPYTYNLSSSMGGREGDNRE